MEIVFLGTSAMQPTKERNHPGIFLQYKGQGILFDCGEGIQRQLRIAGIKLTSITKIFITHWHGDHVLGLPGLIQSMGASEYTGTLQIYGPRGTRKNLETLNGLFAGKEVVDYVAHDVERGTIVDEDDYSVEAEEMKHGTPCLGYAFVEKDSRRILMDKVKKLKITEGPIIGQLQHGEKVKVNGKVISPDDVSVIVPGRKVAYATDTRPCNGLLKLAKHADVLLLESTYKSDMLDKAKEHMHMTAKEAAQVANQAEVKKLYLVHFSQRYKNVQELEEDARDIFDNTEAAEDFMRVVVK